MTATTAAIVPDTIKSYEVGSDTVILLGATALVTSKSTPNTWREVDALLHLCGCPAFAGIADKFEGHGRCRHVEAVKVAEEMDRVSAEPVDDRPTCERCGKRHSHKVLGKPARLCCTCTFNRGSDEDDRMERALLAYEPGREFAANH